MALDRTAWPWSPPSCICAGGACAGVHHLPVLRRQSRLLARACPAEAEHYKSCARYWLTMAHRAQGPPLP
jgi:hypothetical protein